MCYMEQQMQQQMEAGQAKADELHELMDKFVTWCSESESIHTDFIDAFDADIYDFTFTNYAINNYWLAYKAGAGF